MQYTTGHDQLRGLVLRDTYIRQSAPFDWMVKAGIVRDEGLPCAKVAKIVGKGRSTVQRQLNKLGVRNTVRGG